MSHLSSAQLGFRAGEHPLWSRRKGVPSPWPTFGLCHFLDVSFWANHFTSVELYFPHL